MILSNQVHCLKCDDKPYSGSRHDFKFCECGNIAVDGGMDYLRRVGGLEEFTDLSICVSDEHYALLAEALEDPSKNTLGKICNIARVLRDDMGINLSQTYEGED